LSYGFRLIHYLKRIKTNHLKIYSIIIALAIFITACKPTVTPVDNSITVEGNVKGIPDGKVYLVEAHH
jgi:hypothetical protein